MKAIKLATLACLALPAIASADYQIKDGNNVMNIGGQLRTEFATGLNQNSGEASTKYSTVSVNTANLHFAGAINEKLIYKMRLKLAPQNTDGSSTYNMIDYAYAGYSFMPELTVAIGKVPWGIGFDNQSSAMSPLSFAQDVDGFYASGSTNGIVAYGTLMEQIEWYATAVNQVNSQSANNTNRSMDYSFSVAHHSKDAADAEGYNVGGAFKHNVILDFAKTMENGENRKVAAATGFFSYENAVVHAAATNEMTKGRKDDFWTLGAGYLFNKTWRPGITYSSLRSSNGLGNYGLDTAKDGQGNYVAKGRYGVLAVNLTQFHDDNKWRNYFEFSTIQKSDEAKKANTDDHVKNETPWKVSVGLTVNL